MHVFYADTIATTIPPIKNLQDDNRNTVKIIINDQTYDPEEASSDKYDSDLDDDKPELIPGHSQSDSDEDDNLGPIDEDTLDDDESTKIYLTSSYVSHETEEDEDPQPLISQRNATCTGKNMNKKYGRRHAQFSASSNWSRKS